MCLVRNLDQVDMVWKFWKLAIGTEGYAHVLGRLVGRGPSDPLRPEPELAVRVPKSFQEMRGFEVRLDVSPARLAQRVEAAEIAALEHYVDMVALGHAKAWHMRHAQGACRVPR